MIAHPTKQGQTVVEYSWHEALLASGSAETDPVLVQDELLNTWLAGRRCRIIETNAPITVEQAVNEGVEVIIIKEK